MDFRIEDAVKQQIRAHVSLLGRNDRRQVEDGLDAQTAARGRRLHRVVGLRCAIGNGVFAAVGLRLAQQELQLAHLVAAEQAHARKVVALDVEVDAQFLRKILEAIEGRGKEAELCPGKPVKKRIDGICSLMVLTEVDEENASARVVPSEWIRQ